MTNRLPVRTEIALVVLLATLFTVWPVPYTTTLRDVLLFVGLVASMAACGRYRDAAIGDSWHALRPVFVLVAAFLGWMLFVAVVVSPETAWSLDEIRGQWLRAAVALAAGFCAGAVVRASWAFYIVFIPLALHVLAVDAAAAAHVGDSNFTMMRIAGLTEQVDKASYLSNMLFALLLAEAFARLARARPVLPGGAWIPGTVIIATVFSLYVEHARNSIGVIAVMLLFAVALWFVKSRDHEIGRWQRAAVSLAAFALVAGVLGLAAFAKPGNELQRTLATVPVALDTASHKGWLNQGKYGLPSLPDGSPVDESAYLRVAWFKQGLALVADHPLGVGFGRNAFGHAVEATYGERMGHSHSSFIDLLIGIGIPGMALWLGFLGALVWVGWKSFHRDGNGVGLALVFVVVDFGARMVVDSNVRDHMLQMFMFAAALLAAMAARAPSRAEAPPP